ncbi:right-handed parallel beta-helix repeat-containing protein [Nonomuraea sp. NPDC050404]|uniref:right-handed parallel beta-helix repeat-containing protein n=1 Tax=Nonomuraea sp. NPDC050404 TaxID=3155783 RepID=UPI0033F86ABD
MLAVLTALPVASAIMLSPGHAAAAAADPPWPTSPPAVICGNDDVLTGPSTPPAGAITVPAGDNEKFNFGQSGATYWFAPGVHTFGTDRYGHINVVANTTFIGGPGAIMDGRRLNKYAFVGDVPNVTIKYLTIKNFGLDDPLDNRNFNEGVVNHDTAPNWTISYNTISNNDGAGIYIGSNNVVSYNCLKDNGQAGFGGYRPQVENDSSQKNLVLDHNEIVGNNTDDWESRVKGCGCTGGGKFWDVNGARITDNYVHDNKGPGLWADTNNIDFLFEGNFIDHNDGEGIWYEISYNATMRNNTITRNAWVSGQRNQGSPGPAIYLSESGGDSRLASTVSGAAAIRIYDNLIKDNFSGVSIFENADRFCNSNGNTSSGYCTPLVKPTHIPEPYDKTHTNPINSSHPCYTSIKNEPYLTDCRWHAKNIEVRNNEFRFDKTVVPCAGPFCGAQALIAAGIDDIPWSPYTAAGVLNDVMYKNNNKFRDNQYHGDWRFAKGYGDTVSFNSWRAAPFNQDAGSTFDGDAGGAPIGYSDLDEDTSRLWTSMGKWQDWYSEKATLSTDAAHGGKYGLRVDVTSGSGWGVGTSNWPGFRTTPGPKKIGLWGKLGSGTNLQPFMRINWLDRAGAILQTNDVRLPVLTATWQEASELVDAPAGTATASITLHGAGSTGDFLYLDDFTVGPPSDTPPPDGPNLVDADTAGEGPTVGNWKPWYSADVAVSTQEAHSGTGSLCVTVTSGSGWGIALSNWPGFTAEAGGKRISYWGRQGAGAITGVTLRMKWFDAGQALLRTDLVPLTGLTASWQQATGNVTAPDGTATVQLEFYGGSGTANDSVYLDDLRITNAA